MITVEEMRRLEKNASFYGLSEETMMELAGKGLAYEVLNRREGISSVVLIGGTGNNAGDGIVALRYMMPFVDSVEAYIIGSRKNLSELLKKQIRIAEKLGIPVFFDRYGEKAIRRIKRLSNRDVLLDGLFGIGLKGKLGEPYVSLIRAMNASKAYKVAIDVPSGDDRISFEADLTVTFHDAKGKVSGDLSIVDIGLKPFSKLTGPGDVLLAYKRRDPLGHKGKHGVVSVVAGGRRYVGAAILSSQAASILADLSFILTPTGDPKEFRKYPEIIAERLSDGIDLLKKSNAIVVGPGMDEDALEDTLKILNENVPEVPKVVDATALRKEFVKKLKGPKILTPHAGEIRRLGFEPTPEGASMAAIEYDAVVVLKGHVDYITDGKNMLKNPRGKPSMTVGGTGDVLTGIIAGFLARGAMPFRAAAAGAFLNAYASERLPDEGLKPTMLIEEITRVLNEIVSWSSY